MKKLFKSILFIPLMMIMFSLAVNADETSTITKYEFFDLQIIPIVIAVVAVAVIVVLLIMFDNKRKLNNTSDEVQEENIYDEEDNDVSYEAEIIQKYDMYRPRKDGDTLDSFIDSHSHKGRRIKVKEDKEPDVVAEVEKEIKEDKKTMIKFTINDENSVPVYSRNKTIKDRLTIGGSPASDMVFYDCNMNSIHAVMTLENNELHIEPYKNSTVMLDSIAITEKTRVYSGAGIKMNGLNMDVSFDF